MNPDQKMKAERLARRFSTGDGVQLPDGRRGVIRAFGSPTPDRGTECSIEVEDKGPWVAAHEVDLTSVPALNTGKYGGPTRGGSPGGWCGGNSYRSK